MVQKRKRLSFSSRKIVFPIFMLVLLLFFSSTFLINTEAASDKITMDVKQRMLKDEQVPVIILLKDKPSFKTMSKDNAVASLKSQASNSQKSLAALLNEEKSRGKANKIKQLWIVNAIALKASPELIETLAKRDDIASIELYSGGFFCSGFAGAD